MGNHDSDDAEPQEVTAIGLPQGAIDTVIETLRACPLFHNFTSTGLQIIARIARVKVVPANTPLFVENMLADSFYVVMKGEITITVSTREGPSIPMVNLACGASFGELGALSAGSRLCSAIAQSDAMVLEFTRRDFGGLQKSKPQACVKLMTNINEMFAKRLRESQSEFRAFLEWRFRDRSEHQA